MFVCTFRGNDTMSGTNQMYDLIETTWKKKCMGSRTTIAIYTQIFGFKLVK